MEKLLRVFFSGLTKVCSNGGEGEEDELGRIGLLLLVGGRRGQCRGWKARGGK